MPEFEVRGESLGDGAAISLNVMRGRVCKGGEVILGRRAVQVTLGEGGDASRVPEV